MSLPRDTPGAATCEEEEKAMKFLAWVREAYGASHVEAFEENEMTEWGFLLDSDAVREVLEDGGLDGADAIVERINDIESGATDAKGKIEAGRATMFHDFLKGNYDAKKYSEMLVGEGFLDWDSLKELDEATLKECGVKMVGHRKKIFRELVKIRTALATEFEDDTKEGEIGERATSGGSEGMVNASAVHQGGAVETRGRGNGKKKTKPKQESKVKVVIGETTRKTKIRSDDPLMEIRTTFDIPESSRLFYLDSDDDEMTIATAADVFDAIAKKAAIRVDCGPSSATEEKEKGGPPFLFSLGPNEPKKDIGIVLLGQTGAGKSTFKQALFDFARGTPFEEIHETERNEDVKEGESQTKDVRIYEVHGGDFVLKVVDTPGIGDTEGLARDQQHVDNITGFLSRDCVINAICVLLPNGQCRAVAAMGYIINEIKTNLTNDLWPHVFTVVTRCAIDRFPGTDTCANIRKFGLPDASEELRFFRVDNYAYEVVDENMKYPGYLDAKRLAYNNGRDQLHRIVEAAGGMEQRTGETIGELRQYRYVCKEKAKALSVKCENILEIEQGIIDTERELMNARSLQDMHRQFEEEQTIMIQEARTMPNGGKATICQYPKCNNRCHDPCYVSTVGDISGCCAFNGAQCRYCPHKREVHQHTQTYFVEVPQTSKKVDEKSKRKFMAAKNAEEAKRLVRQEFQRKLQKSKEQRQQLGREIGRLNALITNLAVINYNEYFPIYVKELIADIKRSPRSTDQKQREIDALEQQLEEYERSKITFETGGSQIEVAKRAKAESGGLFSALGKWVGFR